MKTQYRIISKFYDLIDVFYFNRKKYSPRQAMVDYINEDKIKVLDICTGTATNSIMIAEEKNNAVITGIDISKDMLNIADEKITERKLNNVSTSVMDATKMEFTCEAFDIVLISLVLHEISVGLANSILSEAKRVLKQDGKMLIIEWEQPNSLFKKIMFLFLRLLEPKGFNKFLKLDFEEYFKANGLDIKSIKHCDYSKVFELTKET